MSEDSVTKSEVSGPKYKRPKWKRPFDFLFAVVGMCVGLGNIWRFPYLCFKNGGGAFLIPYFIFASVLAVPIVILETSIGQKVRRGLAKSWETVPIFKGIAFAQSMVIFHSNVSYPIILVWALKYLVNCFTYDLPWSSCNNAWNSRRCVTPKQFANVSAFNRSYELAGNGTSGPAYGNETDNATVSSATEYWLKEVLKVSSGVDQPGKLCPDLVLYLAILWLGIYLCTFKGVKWTAKIVYVTATLPFLFIAIILVRGVTLEGASEGIKYYLVPDLKRLADPLVWVSAGTQVLYSYGTGCGILATMGSYNDYHHDFLRDSILVSIMNSIASFASGFAVFSTLGSMANYQNTTVDKVASSGPGLAFIAYPEALSLLPLPQFWCALFFLTLLFLGFDSQFVSQESLMSFFFDNFPRLRKHRELTQAVFAVLFMLIGMSMVTEGGVYVFEMYNHYAVAGWFHFFAAGCQCVAVAWCYGFDRYWKDVTDMIGNRFGRLWLMISWKYLAPVICGVTSVYFLVIHEPLTYKGYVYPGWAQFIAHMMTLCSAVWIPGFAIYEAVKIWRRGGHFYELFGRKPPQEKNVEELWSLREC